MKLNAKCNQRLNETQLNPKSTWTDKLRTVYIKKGGDDTTQNCLSLYIMNIMFLRSNPILRLSIIQT